MKISACGRGRSGKSALTSLLANQAMCRGLGVLVVDSERIAFKLLQRSALEKNVQRNLII